MSVGISIGLVRHVKAEVAPSHEFPDLGNLPMGLTLTFLDTTNVPTVVVMAVRPAYAKAIAEAIARINDDVIAEASRLRAT